MRYNTHHKPHQNQGMPNCQLIVVYRVPMSSGSHGKSRKKSSMHGKIMEFEKKLNIQGKIMELCEII